MSLSQALVCLFFGAVVYGIGFWRGITSGLKQLAEQLERK